MREMGHLGRTMICALIVCLLWGIAVPGTTWADELASGSGSPLTEFLESSEIQPPVLDPLPVISSNRVFTISGTAPPSSIVDIYYLVDGNEHERYGGAITASASGRFVMKVSIVRGEGVYRFYGAATKDGRTSEYSEKAAVEFDFTPPGKPQKVMTNTTSHSIEIVWQPPKAVYPHRDVEGQTLPDLAVDHYEIHKSNGESLLLINIPFLLWMMNCRPCNISNTVFML